LKHLAPEAIKSGTYSSASDMWGFGMTCVEMLTRDDPWPKLSLYEAGSAVVQGL
jgi:serine/threonine protein kinase